MPNLRTLVDRLRSGNRTTGVLLSLVATLAFSSAHAEDSKVREAFTDAKLYFTAPVRWDQGNWQEFGASLLVIAAAHEYDDDVRSHFVNDSHAQQPGKDRESTKDAVPAAVLLGGTLLAAFVTEDSGGYTEAWSMAEAGALSGVATLMMKTAFGRARPNDTNRVDDWFGGGDSFPSMHTSIAFAIGTVLAESGNDRYRWIRRALGYGVAGGTAYVRLRENVHWLSDTVAGASLGLATAQFVVNRRQHKNQTASLQVLPMKDGLMLTYSAALH
jgi:hypothetical protein